MFETTWCNHCNHKRYSRICMVQTTSYVKLKRHTRGTCTWHTCATCKKNADTQGLFACMSMHVRTSDVRIYPVKTKIWAHLSLYTAEALKAMLLANLAVLSYQDTAKGCNGIFGPLVQNFLKYLDPSWNISSPFKNWHINVA